MHPVKRLRVLREMSQDDLAEAASVSRQTLSNIERGATTGRPSSMSRIAEALGVPVETVMGSNDPKVSAPVVLRELQDHDRRVLYGLIAAKRVGRTAAMARQDLREFARLKRALSDLGHEDFDLARYIQDSEPGEELRRELDVESIGETLEEALEKELVGQD